MCCNALVAAAVKVEDQRQDTTFRVKPSTLAHTNGAGEAREGQCASELAAEAPIFTDSVFSDGGVGVGSRYMHGGGELPQRTGMPPRGSERVECRSGCIPLGELGLLLVGSWREVTHVLLRRYAHQDTVAGAMLVCPCPHVEFVCVHLRVMLQRLHAGFVLECVSARFVLL